MIKSLPNVFLVKSKQFTAVALTVALLAAPTFGGIAITASNGIVMNGADGIVMTGADGIVMTGADGILNTGANGIVMTGADGIVMTGADGMNQPNSVQMNRADGIVMTGADGIVMTGADGIVMTGADGTTYQATSVAITSANGIVMTGADGIVMTGADGVQQTAPDGIVMTGADGIVMTGADGIVMTGADSLRAVGLDGAVYSIAPNNVRFSGVTGIVMTGADGITAKGVSGLAITGPDGLVITNNVAPSGLQGFDPVLAAQLTRLTDDSNVNVVVVYHQLPADKDIADLQNLGIVGGTRYRVLPMITITATRSQLVTLSHFPAVRSIYGNRTLDPTLEPEVRSATGVERAWSDPSVAIHNGGIPVKGDGVGVAVLDTGIDATHGDLAGRVVQNVKLADAQSAPAGFNYPINLEGLADTDQTYGHGTFVAGVIAGNGSSSSGKYSGVAPAANVVGLSAGDLSLLYVLEGFDYLLGQASTYGVRVINCSFSANTVYDVNDPVNIATKMLTDRGINVVFSAGNNGSGTHSLNPYAVAPWVVSVGATDTQAHLASFSSRGDFASALFHPTLVAPGVSVVSLRGSGIANVTGAAGVAAGADSQKLSASELPYYTTASGTSFSAPQVAGAIALMLEANPSLTPAQVKNILQKTATPLPPYYEHEVGAGMLNVYAAVLQASFPQRRIGAWRDLLNWGQVKFVSDAVQQFSGTAQPGTPSDAAVSIPANTLVASVQIAWGPMWSLNDLGLYLYGPDGTLKGQSNSVNLPGLTGNRERVALSAPNAGSWRASVKNTVGAAVTAQPFVGTVEIGRADYASMNDIATLTASTRSDIYQSLRTFVMAPVGRSFRPSASATRRDLASALVIGGRVPQFMPAQSSYSDVRDPQTTLFVESVQASPNGKLFYDVSPGNRFRPDDCVSRLVAAVAFVRAAGLTSEADAKKNAPLAFLDALNIPVELRGYVAVATSRGFLSPDSYFRPQASLTRAELAHAMTTLQSLAQ